MSKEKDRFKLRFDKKAQKEFDKLDGSVKPRIEKGLARLRARAHEIGIPLQNKRGMKLHGCFELKYRDDGLRIIYRQIDEKEGELEVVLILGVGKRSDEEAFKDASDRLAEFFKELEDLDK